MNNNTGLITVVICAYTEKRWSDLIQAIASIQSQTLSAREIILVIDHNPSLLVRAREELRNVLVVENKQPPGLSGARNTGIAGAGGEIIAFIDEDATAALDWLAWLSRYYNDPQVLGVGGAIEPVWPYERPRWFPPEFDWVVGCTYVGMPEVTQPVRNLIGCNMSFRREVFQKIGGFRDGIGRAGGRPYGCEETELCIRLNQQLSEGQLLYEPRSRVYHQVSVDRTRWQYFVARCWAEGFSKAIVSHFVGRNAGLSSERAYAFQTLPLGILRGLTDVIHHRNLTGLTRSFAILAGFAITLVGYLYGLISFRPAHDLAPNGPASLLPEQSDFNR